MSAVTVSYPLERAYHAGLSISLCAIRPLQDEVPSDKTFRSGSLDGCQEIRDVPSKG